jgi:hypothetical protein
MKLLDDDYNEKEKNPDDVGLVEQERNEELVREVCRVVVDQKLTHLK